MISFLLALLVISALVYALMKQSLPKKRPTPKNSSGPSSVPAYDLSIVTERWLVIHQMQTQGGPGLRSALMEADKLLDYVMQAKGFRGETMGDRLKSGGSNFSNLNAIWSAHKLRNAFAHQVDQDVVAAEVQRAVSDLGQGIRDLGVSL